MTEIFFYASALFLLIEVLVILALVNFVSKKWIATNDNIPILPSFYGELFPALSVFWLILLGLFLFFKWEFLPIWGLWATVSLVMLYPVGRRLNMPYLAYRKPLFILGVLSMIGIPLLGLATELLPPNIPHHPQTTRTIVLVAVVLELTIFSIIAAGRWAIGKPVKMFFRPDILFGDGRILGTGLISLGLSMRFLFAHVPETFPYLPAPSGNWLALYWAVAFGLLQIIPLRGMFKLILRMVRVTGNRWGGWVLQFIKEAWLVGASLSLLYGFHNFFGGKVPTQAPYGFLNGLMPEHFSEAGLPGLISTFLAALFIIFIRGGFKKYACGDPFIRETLRQTIIKQTLFLIGFIWLFYSFAHVMEEKPFFAPPTPFSMWPPALIGWGLFIWGVLMLGPIRIWAQWTQRHAIIAQMAAILLPAMSASGRKQALTKVVHALADMDEGQRVDHMRSMQEAIMTAPEDVRKIMTQARIEVISEIPPFKRKKIMTAMDKVMFKAR